MKRVLEKVIIGYILIITILILGIPTITRAATQSIYYVSPTGSDSNPGTVSQPFLTITKARDVTRNLSSNMTGDIVFYLIHI